LCGPPPQSLVGMYAAPWDVHLDVAVRPDGDALVLAGRRARARAHLFALDGRTGAFRRVAALRLPAPCAHARVAADDAGAAFVVGAGEPAAPPAWCVRAPERAESAGAAAQRGQARARAAAAAAAGGAAAGAFAVCAFGRSRLVAAGGGRAWCSADGGAAWACHGGAPPLPLFCWGMFHREGSLFLWGATACGARVVCASADGGRSWREREREARRAPSVCMGGDGALRPFAVPPSPAIAQSRDVVVFLLNKYVVAARLSADGACVPMHPIEGDGLRAACAANDAAACAKVLRGSRRPEQLVLSVGLDGRTSVRVAADANAVDCFRLLVDVLHHSIWHGLHFIDTQHQVLQRMDLCIHDGISDAMLREMSHLVHLGHCTIARRMIADGFAARACALGAQGVFANAVSQRGDAPYTVDALAAMIAMGADPQTIWDQHGARLEESAAAFLRSIVSVARAARSEPRDSDQESEIQLALAIRGMGNRMHRECIEMTVHASGTCEGLSRRLFALGTPAPTWAALGAAARDRAGLARAILEGTNGREQNVHQALFGDDDGGTLQYLLQ
jgi:hypothetical protein